MGIFSVEGKASTISTICHVPLLFIFLVFDYYFCSQKVRLILKSKQSMRRPRSTTKMTSHLLLLQMELNCAVQRYEILQANKTRCKYIQKTPNHLSGYKDSFLNSYFPLTCKKSRGPWPKTNLLLKPPSPLIKVSFPHLGN